MLAPVLADRIEALPRPGTVIAGKFEIIRAVQSGGMGVVFEARHIITGRTLALKWLKSSGRATHTQVARFIREAQAAGRIHHPHVVDVYDVGEHHGGHYLLMEMLRGESLAERILRGRLGLGDAVQIMLPVMHAVAAAHRRGVTHRDLKPDNIFICHNEDGSVWGPKVLDFGISKVEDLELAQLTGTGAVLGTPHYMSPEQLRGLRETDHRTDIYSLGVILFEALTGYVPYSGDSYGAIAIEIATANLPSLCGLRPDLPAVVQQVIEKAVHRDPAGRYQTVMEFAEALARLSPESVGRHAESAPAVAGPFASAREGSGVRAAPTGVEAAALAANGARATLPWPEPLRIPPTREALVERDMLPAPGRQRGRFALALLVLAVVGVFGIAAFLGGKTTEANGVAATPEAESPVASEARAPQQPPQPQQAASPSIQSALHVPIVPAAPEPPPAASAATPSATDNSTGNAPEESVRSRERRHRRTGSLAPSDF